MIARKIIATELCLYLPSKMQQDFLRIKEMQIVGHSKFYDTRKRKLQIKTNLELELLPAMVFDNFDAAAHLCF